MRERAVGLCHFVSVDFLLDRCALVAIGSHNFFGQFDMHGFTFLRSGAGDQPAHTERGLSRFAHFQRDLVIGATDAARFHLKRRADVFEGEVSLKRDGQILDGRLLGR